MKGSIIKRGNKYSFILDIGKDPVTKKRKQKRVSGFTSKKKAQKAMNEMIADLQRGTYIEPSSETLDEYLDRWLQHKKTRVSPSTYEFYASYINNHIKPALGNIKLFDLKPRDVQMFFDGLLEKGDLSKRSIHHIHRILSNALDSGLKAGDIQHNAAKAVEPAKVAKKEMKYWDMDTLRQFIDYTRQEPFFIAWYLAAFTGMRQGEILGLKWDAIDWENKTIHVKRSLKRVEGKRVIADLKNTSSYRSIAISDSDIFELKRHYNRQQSIKMEIGEDYQDDNLIIATATGNYVYHSNLLRSFKKCIADVGVERIRFHDLRHTHASMLFALQTHPKIVQERLGHSSIQVTLDTYSHMLPNMQSAVAESLESAFIKQKKDTNGHSL
ncbi:site-specific integrase [Lentibacillus sp.]|uniref:site-specific integrase n=1 Tax=Lentibacillus sp. TaxID=1925746 RepID=UPI002B4AE5E3|nr:site-specific integrase [Lentibacillus sp.]HLS10431.1 site-specific integrase [Lentibacillus sp.]